jgi:two-component system response regulator PilR (NtrC family)
MARVLVVDDEASIREFFEILLGRQGHQARFAKDAVEGIAKFKEEPAELVITDLRLPKGSGMDLLRHVKETHPGTQVVMITAFATAENAIEAMKLGAYDYVIKPFKVEELTVVLDKALERFELESENSALKTTLKRRQARNRLVGSSPALKEVLTLVHKVAPTKTTILITGESGTGKELVARSIHTRSPRADDAFVAINCGAVPENLLESEFFGHIKGAFTGAVADKQGLLEKAHGGTIFLDEIGELPMSMQVKLLRVLQDRKIRPVGAVADKEVDVRVIAATNRDLQTAVQRGEFREDLYFRLNVIEMRLPALRERRGDIPLLAETFLHTFAEQQQSPITEISDAALAKLVSWRWPGNVRELENVIERGVTLASSDIFDVGALPAAIAETPGETLPHFDLAMDELPDDGISLEAMLEDFERRILHKALEKTGGKKKKAADLLGLSFRSFRYRVAKLGVGDEDDAESNSS